MWRRAGTKFESRTIEINLEEIFETSLFENLSTSNINTSCDGQTGRVFQADASNVRWWKDRFRLHCFQWWSTYWPNGYVSKQKFGFWRSENPHVALFETAPLFESHCMGSSFFQGNLFAISRRYRHWRMLSATFPAKIALHS